MNGCWAGCGVPLREDHPHLRVQLTQRTVLVHYGDCEEKLESFIATGGICLNCGITPPDPHPVWCEESKAKVPT